MRMSYVPQYRPRHAAQPAPGPAPGHRPGTDDTPPAGTAAVPSGGAPAGRRHLGPRTSLALAGAAMLAVGAGLVVLSLPGPSGSVRLTGAAARALRSTTAATRPPGHAPSPTTRRTSPTGTSAATARSVTTTTAGAPGSTATGSTASARPATTAPGAAPVSNAPLQPYTEAAHSPAVSPGLASALESSPATNAPTPSGLGPELRAAWVAVNPGGAGLSAIDVQATVPGSVFYAVQPATGYDWAITRFLPSLTAEAAPGTPAGHELLAQFADEVAFRRPPGGTWAYVASFPKGGCTGAVPLSVFAAWGMCSVGS